MALRKEQGQSTFTASTPLVNGANQTGSTLNSNGWASGATTLKKGDVFTFETPAGKQTYTVEKVA